MAYTRRTANFEKNESFKNSETSPIAGPSQLQKPTDNFVSLSSINPYITCPLCNGYFVDATTVIDCLHTFCKSCLLKYFDEDNTDCPKCHYQIHQSHPSHYVAFDRTMQDIVYKLVPGMQAEEQRRREQFKIKQKKKEEREQQQNGCNDSEKDGICDLTSNESETSSKCNEEENKEKEVSTNAEDECCSSEQDPALMHRRNDEPVLIHLIPDAKLSSIDRSFVRLSAFATINTVKRLLAYLLLADITKYNEFDIFCNHELMGRDFSMWFRQWFNGGSPTDAFVRGLYTMVACWFNGGSPTDAFVRGLYTMVACGSMVAALLTLLSGAYIQWWPFGSMVAALLTLLSGAYIQWWPVVQWWQPY
uniref:RING-type domain-containing protein n=1 Tax=Meloidogyne hapla TaxID=6305 RepID=A0A1I8AXW6_MELHA